MHGSRPLPLFERCSIVSLLDDLTRKEIVEK
jgi:hypothetical protein